MGPSWVVDFLLRGATFELTSCSGERGVFVFWDGSVLGGSLGWMGTILWLHTWWDSAAWLGGRVLIYTEPFFSFCFYTDTISDVDD